MRFAASPSRTICGWSSRPWGSSPTWLTGASRSSSSSSVCPPSGVSGPRPFRAVSGGLAPLDVPARIAKGQGSQDIPVILLARLAVDISEQDKGLGAHMLLDALRRAVEGAEVIGGRAILVHAQDEGARGFYQRYGFETSPTDDLHLLMLVKDLRETFGM